jgi:muramidase (phage lysozyme)
MAISLDTIGITDLTASMNQINAGLNSIALVASNLDKEIDSNTRLKENLLTVSEDLHRKKLYNIKRQEQEDVIEVNKTNITASDAISFSERTADNIFGRIFNLSAFVGVGWLVKKYDEWENLGDTFNENVANISDTLKNSFTDILNYTESFGYFLNTYNSKVGSLNINEQQKIIYNSFDDLYISMNSIQNSIYYFFRNAIDSTKNYFDTLINSALGRGGGAGEGEGDGTGATGGSVGGEYSMRGGKALYGTPEQRAALDAIAWAEGAEYNTMFGGGKFSTAGGWKHPDRVIRSNGYASAAAGRYQFMPFTWEKVKRKLGLSDFSPENQDRAAIELMNERLKGNSAEILRKEGLSDRVLNLLAPEWASLPTYSGGSYYGQPSKNRKAVKKLYNSAIQNYTTMQTMPSSIPPLGRLGFKAYRDRGSKGLHAGIDIDPADDKNAIVYARLGGILEFWGYDDGGYYDYIDIYNKELNLVERIAEFDTYLIPKQKGYKIYPGQPVGKGCTKTGVFHYEIRRSPGKYLRTLGMKMTISPLDYLKSPEYNNYINKTLKPVEKASVEDVKTSDLAFVEKPKRDANILVNSGDPNNVVIVDNSTIAYNQEPTSTPTSIVIQNEAPKSNYLSQIIYRSLAYT